jgi:lysosomal acid lipase/cholesteryl ester hydrolase
MPIKNCLQVEIIASRGYPVEIHEVVTEDGYILELHRIPYGKGQVPKRDVEKQVVFIQHGFLNTDNVWLITPNDQGLGNYIRAIYAIVKILIFL